MRKKTTVVLRSCYCSSPLEARMDFSAAKVRGKQYQFVTTLLETFSPDVPAEQTRDLLCWTAEFGIVGDSGRPLPTAGEVPAYWIHHL